MDGLFTFEKKRLVVWWDNNFVLSNTFEFWLKYFLDWNTIQINDDVLGYWELAVGNDHLSIIHAKVPKEALSAAQEVHDASHQGQYLMKLKPDVEVTRASLLNRDLVPSLDVCWWITSWGQADINRALYRISTAWGQSQSLLQLLVAWSLKPHFLDDAHPSKLITDEFEILICAEQGRGGGWIEDRAENWKYETYDREQQNNA